MGFLSGSFEGLEINKMLKEDPSNNKICKVTGIK